MKPWVWVVIGIVVLLIIVGLLIAARKNSASAKRDEAQALRAKAQDRDLKVREREAAAAQTAADAQAARAEAQQQTAAAQQSQLEAEKLARQTAHRQSSLQSARSERDDLLRRADEVDPDVRSGGPRHGRSAAHDERSAAHGDQDDDSRYEPDEHARGAATGRVGPAHAAPAHAAGAPTERSHAQAGGGVPAGEGRHARPTERDDLADSGAADRRARGDQDGDGRYELNERARDKMDDLRGRRDTDGDGRRG